MKKLYSAILSFVILSVCLCGCVGNEKGTSGVFESKTEKLVRKTEFVRLGDIREDIAEDVEKAMDKYNGKMFKTRVYR